MAGQLLPSFVFGVKADVAEGIAAADEGSLLYTAGNYLVRYAFSSRSQELVPLRTVGSAGASCMGASQNRRYIAVGEKSSGRSVEVNSYAKRKRQVADSRYDGDDDGGAQIMPPAPADGDGAVDMGAATPSYNEATITLYNTRTMQKRRVIRVDEALQSDKPVSLAFSSDDSVLLALGGALREGPMATSSDHEAEAAQDTTPSDAPALSKQPYLALFSIDSGELLASVQVASPQQQRSQSPGSNSSSPSPPQQLLLRSSASSSAGGSRSASPEPGRHGITAGGSFAFPPSAAGVGGASRTGSRGTIGCEAGGGSGEEGIGSGGDGPSAWGGIDDEQHPPSRGSMGSAQSNRSGGGPLLRSSTKDINSMASTRNLLGGAIAGHSSSKRLHQQQLLAQQRAAQVPLRLRGARFNSTAPSLSLSSLGGFAHSSSSGSIGGHGTLGCCAVVYGDCIVSFYAVGMSSPLTTSAIGISGSTSGSHPAAASAAKGSPNGLPHHTPSAASSSTTAAGTNASGIGGSAAQRLPSSYSLQQLPLCAGLADWLARYGPASPHCSFRSAGWLSDAVCVIGTGAGDLLLFEHAALASVIPADSGRSGSACGDRPVSSATANTVDSRPSSVVAGGSGGARGRLSRATGTIGPGSHGGGGGGGGSGGPSSIDSILIHPQAGVTLAALLPKPAARPASRSASLGLTLGSLTSSSSGSDSCSSNSSTPAGSIGPPAVSTAAAPAAKWAFAVGGSNGAVRLYSMSASSKPAPPPSPSGSGGSGASSPAIASIAFEVTSTWCAPPALVADLDDATVKTLTLSPAGTTITAALAGCHLFSFQPERAFAAAAAAVSTRHSAGSSTSSAIPSGSAPVQLLMEPLPIQSHSPPPSSGSGHHSGDGTDPSHLSAALKLSAAAAAAAGSAAGAAPSSSAIVSMDLAVRRPLIATMGASGMLRLWNYVDRCCEVAKQMTDGPTCVSIHPRCAMFLLFCLLNASSSADRLLNCVVGIG